MHQSGVMEIEIITQEDIITVDNYPSHLPDAI